MTPSLKPERLAALPNKLIVVERDRFKITLWRRKPDEQQGKPIADYQCAIGARMFGTPKMYGVVDVMDDSPEWKMPDSDWVRDAGLTPGTILNDDDPNNPIKARWIGFNEEGIGFHGTADDDSIGKRASHGCIRMHVWDIEDFYDKVELGTAVYVD